MIRILKPHWPLIAGTGLLLVIFSLQLTLSLNKNDGHFVYALDDPYIHMAVARNFVRQGVWGVTPYEFSSSTSSLLWTLLLAAGYLFTSSAYVPLILNLVSAFLVVLIGYFLLESLSKVGKLAVLCAFVVLLPLPVLVFSGMEHTAHTALCLLLVSQAATLLTEKESSLSRSGLWWLLLLALTASMVRYESLFLILPVALLLSRKRQFRAAMLLLIVPLVPLTLYGLISLSHGSFFLPNPLLLKGTLPRAGTSPFLQQGLSKLLAAPHLLFLLLVAVSLFLTGKKDSRAWQELRALSLIFIWASFLHLLFAGIGWFYRYEAYLVAIGILISGKAIVQVITNQKESPASQPRKLLSLAITLVLALTALVVLSLRASRAIGETVKATKNIYDQHYQMARFLKSYYSGEAVAANDIGAINFMADIRCLDLRGLGSVEVARAKLRDEFNTQKIAELAISHRVRIALLYSIWFQSNESVPESWIKVGQWTIRDCVVCGNPEVSFYAVDLNEAARLKQNLKDFSTSLPADVVQAGPYYESK